MSNSFLQAAENVQAFARQYKALMDVAAILRNAGNLDNHCDELKGQIEKLKAEKAKAITEADEASQHLFGMRKAVDEANALLAKTDEDKAMVAAEIAEHKAVLIKAANAEIDEKLAAADKKAKAIVYEANKKAEEADALVVDLKKQEKLIQENVDRLKAELAALKARF